MDGPGAQAEKPSSEGLRAVLAALGANLGIAVTKLVAFAITGSASMLAESVHSVADSGNQALLLLGRHRARQEQTEEHPQVARRREVSTELAAQRGIEVSELAADGGTPLQRLASLIQLIDYATVYLGIAIGVDPGPIAVIGELKERIA